MQHAGLQPNTRSLWIRLAAFLGFVAVLSALLAPVAMLAQEVSSGKLSGICSLSTGQFAASAGLDGPDDQGSVNSEASSVDRHCALCTSPGSALATGDSLRSVSPPGRHQPSRGQASAKALAVAGLPFSRGPPQQMMVDRHHA